MLACVDDDVSVLDVAVVAAVVTCRNWLLSYLLDMFVGNGSECCRLQEFLVVLLCCPRHC